MADLSQEGAVPQAQLQDETQAEVSSYSVKTGMYW